MTTPRYAPGAANDDKWSNTRWAAALALAYFVGSELGYILSLGPSVGGTFWPPAGITLAFFLTAPRRAWPILLVAASLANLLSDVLHGQNLPATLGFAAANIGEALAGAVLLRRLLPHRVTFTRLSELAMLSLVVAFVSAPPAAALGAYVAEGFTPNPPGFPAGWRTWWVGDAVGAIVLTPFVVRLIREWHRRRAIAAGTWLEAAAFGFTVVAVTQLVFSAPPSSIAMPLLVFPVLLWGSLRLGMAAVGAALCAVVVLTTRDTTLGLGPFAVERLSLGDRLIELQIYVGVMALSFYALAALWEERARTAAALQVAHQGLEARHRRIVEQAPLAIVSIHPDGSVSDANPAWREIWGTTATRTGGWPSRQPGLAALVDRAFTGEIVELPERELATGSGSGTGTRRVRGFAYPVKDDADRVTEVVVIEQDITEAVAAHQRLVDVNRSLREREEELSHALREMAEAQAHREQLLTAERVARSDAERASRLKDEFLSTLSHELRTPLNAIVGWAHILGKGPDPSAAERAIEAIVRNAHAQSKLIEDLLDMSRIAAGKISLVSERVRATDIVSAAVSALQPVAQAKGVTLSLTDDTRGTWIAADAMRLQQVVTNLLDNGIRFTPAGGHVDLTTTAADGAVRIVVRDDGAGIPPDFLPSVFDRFRQADGSTTRRHGGLGLGLSIARQIVILHGGTIEAQSDGQGHGAAFTVTLPVAAEGATPMVAGSPEETAADALVGLRLIVVDDHDDGRELLRRLLEDHGCVVTAVSSAREALRALDGGSCDMLVTDIGMPDMDGYELLRLVRSGAHAGTKVVAVTAFARAEDRTRAMAAGFDDHVAKPVTPAQFLRAVTRLASRRPVTAPSAHGPRAVQ